MARCHKDTYGGEDTDAITLLYSSPHLTLEKTWVMTLMKGLGEMIPTYGQAIDGRWDGSTVHVHTALPSYS